MELKTPLYDMHVKYKGKIVPFAGYLLPVQYEKGVIAEHMAVREQCGLFDVSHMGEILLSGPDALKNVNMLLTNDYTVMEDGTARYSPMCNEAGGVVDDLIVYKIKDNSYFIVVNASNKDKDYQWMKDHVSGDVELKDISGQVGQLALQGPKALDVLKKVADPDAIPDKYYTFKKDCCIDGIPCIISKTGYTGEDGVEIYMAGNDAPRLWELLLEAGREEGLIPCVWRHPCPFTDMRWMIPSLRRRQVLASLSRWIRRTLSAKRHCRKRDLLPGSAWDLRLRAGASSESMSRYLPGNSRLEPPRPAPIARIWDIRQPWHWWILHTRSRAPRSRWM